MNGPILYVDDEPDNLAVFKASFEDDFEVLCASSAEEALRTLESLPVPVVIADQRMPGMTGVELFAILCERYPHTKRIVLTGYIDPSAMLAAINAGRVYYFLTKPWQREQLHAVMVRALEAHRLELQNSSLAGQLVSSQQLASLGHATARIAHEMSNQLCMLPLLEHIEEAYSHDQTLLELAGFSRAMYNRLNGLLDEVKAFARSNGNELPMHPLNLGEAVQEVASFLRFDREIDCARLRVSILVDPPVWGNKLKIQQVVQNLVKNASWAIRGKEDGRIRIDVTTCEGSAVLQVSDNGCGIPDQIKHRIWEPFFTTKGENGTGLGLDICRDLIRSHKGELSFENETGKETRFVVKLPLLSFASAT